jgi:hypothetical protein
MAGKVLDLEVGIQIMSIVLGSTSTSFPFLSDCSIEAAHLDLVQVFCYFPSSTFSSQWGDVFKSLPKSHSTVSTICIL